MQVSIELPGKRDLPDLMNC